jgi:hypothetical protein
MLRWLVLPWGRTSGQRIVLDADTGTIQIYNASDVLVAEVSVDGFTAYSAAGTPQLARLNSAAVEFQDSDETYDSLPEISHTASALVSSLSLESGDVAGGGERAIVTLTSAISGNPRVQVYSPGGIGADQCDMDVRGMLSARNIASGMVQIVPVANSPTSVAVTGLNVAGTSFSAFATALTAVPGSTVIETSVNNLSATSLNVCVYRTNTTTTGVYWMVIGR